MLVLGDELAYEMEHLVAPDGTRPYCLGYTVTETERVALVATLGGITVEDNTRRRHLDVDVRVGDYALDNTHNLRGGRVPPGRGYTGTATIALDDDAEAIRRAAWLATDAAFKSAVRRYARVRTNVKVKVEEEDRSDDFSREAPSVHLGQTGRLAADRDAWAARLRKLSAIAREHPLIHDSQLALQVEIRTRHMVTSEGTRLRDCWGWWRLRLGAASRAEDGMELMQSFSFDRALAADGSAPTGLPGDDAIAEAFRGVIRQVLALREAPLVEPYTGPAILRNRAAAVFFHEIFGHRIEGHRQKDVEEGQTFTGRIGRLVLPEFISIRDDPTTTALAGEDLRGAYRFDDEGIPARDVTLVDSGILRTFLLSRSPVAGFEHSNGHGRRQPGYAAVSRQGNLVVSSTRQVSFEELRQRLIRECTIQGKPYGLLFEDITGGFTGTGRRDPQTFKVLPIVVYRVYPDGRPDELVRGADVVGTPLASLEKIACTGDDPAVFNGDCGAESGWVPVSAVSPSILVTAIEIEKRQRSQDRPPILPPPIAEAPR